MSKKRKLAYYGALQDRAIAKLRKMPRAQRELLTKVTRLQAQCADLSEKLAAAEDRERRAKRGMDMAEENKALFAKEGSAEVRVLRIIEYRGPQRWVEETVQRSIHGTKKVDTGKFITVVTLHEYPETVRVARHASDIPPGSDAPLTFQGAMIPETAYVPTEPCRG
jgi:hypothetical protein